MQYADFLLRDQFSKIELLALAKGNFIVDSPYEELARLPSPPFLMFDRITDLVRTDGKRRIVAEQDIAPDAWYFQCHFQGDPVQPGCLGLDAVWQLLGFYCMACGAKGSGRALGCGGVEFAGQIRPYDEKVRYEVNVKRFSVMKNSGTAIAIADAKVFVRDECIYTVSNAKVGCFTGLAYRDYPNPESPQARGGLLVRERSTSAGEHG